MQIELTASHLVNLSAISHVRDIIVRQTKLPNESKFFLATIFVHQWIPYNDLATFLTNWQLQYSDPVDYFRLEDDMTAPIVLDGDFNLFENDRDILKDYLRKQLKNYPSEHTTLTGSCINLTFSRYIHLVCEPRVIRSYSIRFLRNFHIQFNFFTSFTFILNGLLIHKTFLHILENFNVKTYCSIYSFFQPIFSEIA